MDDDDELVGSSRSEASLPLNAVTKLVKEALPDGVRCDAAVSPLVQACLGEFVQMLASQASERATAEKKATVSEAHALFALEELGFGHYAAACRPAEQSATGNKLIDGGGRKKKGKRKLPDHGLSQEELLRQQQELFAGAAAAYGGAGGGASGATAVPPQAAQPQAGEAGGAPPTAERAGAEERADARV